MILFFEYSSQKLYFEMVSTGDVHIPDIKNVLLFMSNFEHCGHYIALKYICKWNEM